MKAVKKHRRSKKIAFGLVAVMSLFSSQAVAKVCDYRLSELMGGGATGTVAGVSGTAAVVGVGAKAAGFYTLTHAVTGATMLGSTAGGASAAGTVGIMGGTTVLGPVAAVVMSPFLFIATAVVGVGIIGSEAYCYFQDERITDEKAILDLMKKFDKQADADHFKLVKHGGKDAIRVKIGDESEVFLVENLFIVNGVLKHDDWFRNTVIGHVNFMQAAIPEDKK